MRRRFFKAFERAAQWMSASGQTLYLLGGSAFGAIDSLINWFFGYGVARALTPLTSIRGSAPTRIMEVVATLDDSDNSDCSGTAPSPLEAIRRESGLIILDVVRERA